MIAKQAYLVTGRFAVGQQHVGKESTVQVYYSGTTVSRLLTLKNAGSQDFSKLRVFRLHQDDEGRPSIGEELYHSHDI